MDTTLIVGIILLGALIGGEIARVVKLPKITGYILAGIAINPRLMPIIPRDFTDHTEFITNLALAFITFSVGGSLLYSHIKRLGRSILWIAIGEAQTAMLTVGTGIFVVGWLLGWPAPSLLALLLAPLATPTDPSATLAIAHEYRARGDVTTTIMGVAALDDVLAILNFSLATSLASLLAAAPGTKLGMLLWHPTSMILIGVGIGITGGLAFNILTELFRRETEGALIVLIFAALTLVYGTVHLFGGDELLGTLSMGTVVANFNPRRQMIFKMLERYTEELIFALFFTLSGMLLDLEMLGTSVALIVGFVVLRSLGKWLGSRTGAALSHASIQVKRHLFWGLLPQGGIVIGLALLLKNNPDFAGVADTVMSVILGATVIHELIGPLLARRALQKAGEIAA